MDIAKLVIMRHGESLWNRENRFTGWCDIDLSKRGIEEAKTAGKILKEKGFSFNFAYTSLLKRAIHTLWIILDELDQVWIPIEKSWKLNERHYGILQGLKKEDVINVYGNKQFQKWHRGYKDSPPKVDESNNNINYHDELKYKNLTKDELPLSESLEITVKRVVSYWKEYILPRLVGGDCIIIVAHGNSIRALIKYLNNMKEEEIFNLNIPNGIPLVFNFDDKFKLIKYYYLDNKINNQN